MLFTRFYTVVCSDETTKPIFLTTTYLIFFVTAILYSGKPNFITVLYNTVEPTKRRRINCNVIKREY